MAAEGTNNAYPQPGFVHYTVLRQAPLAAGTTTAWIDLGAARISPVLASQGHNTTTVGVTWQTYMGDDTPTVGSTGIAVGSTITTASGAVFTAPSAALGRYIRVVTNNTTTAATLEAYYLGTTGFGAR